MSLIHPELWNILRSLDPDDVCRRSGAQLDEKGAYLLPILGKNYRIDPSTSQMNVANDAAQSNPPGFFLQLTAVNYLIRAKNLPLAGEIVPPEQFPTGDFFFRGYHQMPTAKLMDRFGRDAEAFVAAGLALGGKQVDLADAAVELPVFPRLPVTVALWLADEEFPAEIKFFFDRTADQHMILDGLWSVGFVVRDELLAAAPE